MSRVALLMGVSRYPQGLDPLPDAQNDVEVLKGLLEQPQFQFQTVQCLCDRPLTEMQEAIELFFKQRTPDDQVVFWFGGYTLQDADGKCYWATPSTKLDAQGAIVKAQTIPLSGVQEAMNQSPAKQQVMILDTYLRPVRQAPPAEAAVLTQLSGAGRVILAAADPYQRLIAPAELDVWTYTRYLVEGVESGAADTDDNGLLTATEVHQYATQKLQLAAPAMQPQSNGSQETAQMPLFEVPLHHPQTRYRKVLEASVAANTIDVAGAPLLTGRSLLHDLRHSLGLSLQDATAIERQVLQPLRDYRQRMAFYQQHVAESTRSQEAATRVHQDLQELQEALCLKDSDVAMLAIAPFLAEQQRQQAYYQTNLAHYQQVLLGAMQRQYPLQESDRLLLRRLQQALQLQDDDVQALEEQIVTQATQLANFTPVSAQSASDRFKQPSSPGQTPAPPAPEAKLSTEPNPALAKHASASPSVETPPASFTGASNAQANAPPEESRAKEVVLHRLLHLSEPAAPPVPPASESRLTPVAEVLRPVPSNPNPTAMDRIRRSAAAYQALLIPAILLAAIMGLLAAFFMPSNRADWFKFGQKAPDPVAAQQFNQNGLQKTQSGSSQEVLKAAIDDYNKAIDANPSDPAPYINRGVTYYKLGNLTAAQKDDEKAIALDPSSALAHSNLSHVYYDRQDYDKALEAGNQAVVLDDKLAEAHINLANARSKTGDLQGALNDYNRAIALRPIAPVLAGAYNDRGNVQFALNKIPAALNDYQQAIRLQSNYADAYYNTALAQQALKNQAAAINNFQIAAKLYLEQDKEALHKDAMERVTALQQGKLQSMSAAPLTAAQTR